MRKQSGMRFKTFLDKSTNLITIFGVLNALFIYATTLSNKTVAGFLLPSLFVLSLLIWYELIVFAREANNGSRKYELFFVLACAIELGLIMFFLKEFKPLILLFLLYGMVFAGTYLVFRVIVWFLTRRVLKNRISVDRIFYLLVIISLLSSFFIVKVIGQPIMGMFKYLLDFLSFDFSSQTAL